MDCSVKPCRQIAALIFCALIAFLWLCCGQNGDSPPRSELEAPMVNFPTHWETVRGSSLLLNVVHPMEWENSPITLDFELFSQQPSENSKILASRYDVHVGESGYRDRADIPPGVFSETDSGTTGWLIERSLEPGLYWWQSRAKRGDVMSPWMAAAPFIVTASSTPVLNYPARDTIVCSRSGPLSVTVPMNGEIREKTLDIQLATDHGFLDVLFSWENMQVAASGEFVLSITPKLADRMAFWWRARIRGDGEPESWSLPSRFFTEELTPPLPVKPIPTMATSQIMPELVVINSSLHCDYQPRYEFELALDPGFVEIIDSGDVAQGEFEVTSWTVTIPLDEGRQYFWRARSILDENVGRWSEQSEFTIDASAHAGDEFADSVVYCGVSCLDSVRYQDCNEALGEPDFYAVANPENPEGFDYYGFVSLGIRGSIILDMGEGTEIINGDGADLKVWQSVSSEQFQVFVAESASGPYFDLGAAGSGWFSRDMLPDLTIKKGPGPFYRADSACYTTSGNGGYGGQIGWCDIAATGLTKVRYVRVLDLQPWGDLRKDCFGFDYDNTGEWQPYLSAGSDIDAVKAIHMP